jgi:deaminated glutathione amidase
MKVAAIQMVAGGDLTANLQRAAVLLKQAALAGAELAALPEYFCLIGSKDTDKLAISESSGDGEIQQFFCRYRA